MSDIKSIADYLRKYNAWRRGEDERTMDEAGIVPKEVGMMIDAAVELLEARAAIVARAQGDVEKEAEKEESKGDFPLKEESLIRKAARAQSDAEPESIEVAIDMLEDYASALGNGDLDGAGHSTTACIHEVIDQLATAPQSPLEQDHE